MIQEAFISGQIGKVIYAEDDRYFVLGVDEPDEPVECRPMDISMFFGYGAEFTTLSGTRLDLADIKSRLATQRQAYLALTLIISGLDRDLDGESRAAAIEAAEELFKEESTRRFVRARMLARPVPEEADVEVARDIAIRSEAVSVGILYQNILDYEQAINLVFETWLEAAPEYFSSHDERVESERMLTDLGVFADMASAIATGNLNALSSVVITYKNKLRQGGVLILNDLRTRLASKGSVFLTQPGVVRKDRKLIGESEVETKDTDPVHEILDRFKHRREHHRSRTFSADEAKAKVDHQIEAIGELIQRGNIDRANRYLRNLIDFHVEHSKREHLGMSLCSLAKVALDANAFELAEKMVHYALMLGIDDVVISNTQAQMFKATGQFDRALAIYEETMKRFPNNEVVRNGYAEVLKATGRFDEALAAYEEAMERFPNDEVARGGYAEVLKEMGQFDRALAIYEETMERFPNNKVVRNGYAGILILMNKFTAARSLLSETHLSSKQDWIGYHIIAMSYLKSGDIDEAIQRLTYGFETTPWPAQKNYFATALGVAKIKKKQFAEVIDVLQSNVVSLDVFQRQARLVLIGHSQAALGRQDEAIQTLANLEQASNPRVISVKDDISRRYNLRQQADTSLSAVEASALDAKIEEEEFLLAMAA